MEEKEALERKMAEKEETLDQIDDNDVLWRRKHSTKLATTCHDK